MWQNIRALFGLVQAFKEFMEFIKKWKYESEKKKGEQAVDDATKNEEPVQQDKQKPIEDQDNQVIKDAVDQANGSGTSAPSFPRPTKGQGN